MWVIDHTSKDSLSSVLATMWASWYFRNKQIFEGVGGDHVSIARSFNNMVEEYKLYNGSTSVSQQSSFLHYQSWRPPSNGWVKVNFDAYEADNAIRGLGVVVRDSYGKLLVAGVRRIKSLWPVDICEAAAALFGIQVALRIGCEYIHLKGDSLSVISAINHVDEGQAPIHLFYDSIFDLSSNVSGFVCSFVRRNENSLAHLVAR
jgi:reverse transcriptase-like protein